MKGEKKEKWKRKRNKQGDAKDEMVMSRFLQVSTILPVFSLVR